MTVRFNHPDDIPTYFGPLKIIGGAENEIKKYRQLHAHAGLTPSARGLVAATQVPTHATPNKQPMLSTTKEVKAAYQTNNWSKISQLETQAQNDLQPVYTNITNKGDSAWVKVQASNGQQYYMTWSSKASAWSYTQSITAATDADIAADPNTKYQAVVQYGTFSQTTSIAGIHSYNLGLTTMVVESVVAMILAKTISGFIADGLGFLVAQFAVRLTTAAAELGLESFSFAVPEFLIGAVAGCICFAIIFIGLAYLWNWLNRKYTIRVQVFNWDQNNNWQLTKQSKSNAVNPGKDSNTNQLGISIDKMTDPNSVVYPPGFGPVTSLDSICYYAIIVYENDNTFMEGCSFGIQATCANDSTKGFTYAFQCPRWSDNGQYMQGSVQDPATFLNNAGSHWQSNPKSFNITANGVPVSATIDALQGAPDQLYNVNIHINKSA